MCTAIAVRRGHILCLKNVPTDDIAVDLKKLIRNIPDHPKPGIVFRDITTLLVDGEGFQFTVAKLTEFARDLNPDKIAGIEARGFIVGGAVAHQLGLGFVPIRKAGKLPWKTTGRDYELEYGTDRVEIHTDMLAAGERVLLIDDLIATGGTAVAGRDLVASVGAEVVGAAFIIDLPELGGSAKLGETGLPMLSLVSYQGL